MSNRFRNSMLRRQYDACLHCFRVRHKDLIHPTGIRHRGNAAADYFWRGYDLVKMNWDARMRQSPAYAAFRAGEDVRHFVDKGVYEAVPT